MESCGINSVGANQYLQDGLGHTKFTSIMEGMDNSQKALKNNLSGKIEVYNTEEYQIIKDNGIGMKNIDDNLEKNNIQTRVVLTGNILRQPAFRKIKCFKKKYYKYADKVMKNSLLIACHHGLSKKEIKYIYSTMDKFFIFKKIN